MGMGSGGCLAASWCISVRLSLGLDVSGLWTGLESGRVWMGLDGLDGYGFWLSCYVSVRLGLGLDGSRLWTGLESGL
jgi:hypothetical protein